MEFNGINFVNLTPHDVTIAISEEERLTIPFSGCIARVSLVQENLSPIAGIPVIRSTFGQVEGLPSPVEGTVYIVSAMTASAVGGRGDLYTPGDLVRDDEGQVIGCKGLKKV